MTYALDTEVVVVGGGPAGAATAWALGARRRRRVRGRSRAVPARQSLRGVLEPAGLASAGGHAGARRDRARRRRAPRRHDCVCSQRGVRSRDGSRPTTAFVAFRDHGLALRRETLDAILLDAARTAGARVEEAAPVVGVLREPGGRAFGVRIAGEHWRAPARELRARLVIGADGLRSVISRRLGLARQGRWPRRIAFVSHYTGVEGVGENGEMHVARDGYCGIADVGGGVTNVAVVVPAGVARRASGGAEAFVDARIACHPALRDRFAAATRISPVRATGPFAQRAHRGWAPGAALVGDAAEFFDPFTGEGIYTALRGGELLAPFAAEAARAQLQSASNTALAAYERARHQEFRGKWRVERLVGLAVGVPALLNHAAGALARRRHLADLLVGVAGDFVPARAVLRPGFLLQLLVPPGPG